MRIGIIGAGWYGCHIALILTKEGHQVELFERNKDIFQGISGNFGIRLHKGPHYPRSEKTRINCQEDFEEFYRTYPDFLVEHDYSIYALGKKDAHANESKVSVEQFKQVCFESQECKEIILEESVYNELNFAAFIHEPSIILGERLRQKFREKLIASNIKINLEQKIIAIETVDGKSSIISQDGSTTIFDKIINATSFQHLIPETLAKEFPVEMEPIYQPCLGLMYEDLNPSDKPISFIVMDGWFPCLMPYIEEEPYDNKYVITHGSFTIMGSLNNITEAQELLNKLTDDFINTKIKPRVEQEMSRFWPIFVERFKYLGWKGTVLAKLKTQTEFRSAVTFEKDNVVYVIPGKVSNIFTAGRETVALVNNFDCLTENNIKMMRNGILDSARMEIESKPNPEEANTCNLNTYLELSKSFLYNFFPLTQKDHIITIEEKETIKGSEHDFS